jgi:hypothetical protein
VRAREQLYELREGALSRRPGVRLFAPREGRTGPLLFDCERTALASAESPCAKRLAGLATEGRRDGVLLSSSSSRPRARTRTKRFFLRIKLYKAKGGGACLQTRGGACLQTRGGVPSNPWGRAFKPVGACLQTRGGPPTVDNAAQALAMTREASRCAHRRRFEGGRASGAGLRATADRPAPAPAQARRRLNAALPLR